MANSDNDWHLDKKVPIALILAMLGQVVVVVWWGAGLSALSTAHERRLDQAERRLDSSDAGTRTLSEKVIRIEANTDNIVNSIRRIETAVRPEPEPRR